MEHEHHTHHEHQESHATYHKKKSMTEKIRTNPWIVSTFVLGILAIILIVGSVSGGITGKTISQDKAAELVLGFVESQVGEEAELISVSSESGLYKVIVLFQGSEVPLYLTKDGKNLVQGVLPLSALEPQSPSQTEPAAQEIVKSDVPEVELFVMTHCPYGTQAEKGFIPAILELGDEIDSSIKFVHYFLHDPEETETPIQVCIREEQSDKFLSYLKCFLEDGDSARCVLETGVDQSKLDDCIQNNADDYYAIDSALSEDYGVRGSPSLVINGQLVSSGRSAAAYLDTICQAFNTPPELCGSLDLDDANPSAGFGYGTTTGIASAQC